MAGDTNRLIIHAERVFSYDQSLTLPAPHGEYVRVANSSINVGNAGYSQSETTHVPSEQSRISGHSVIVQTVQPPEDLPSQYSDFDFEAGKKYNKYIIVGLITALLCCCPFGLLATYYARQAKVSAINREEEETFKYTSWATSLIIWAVFTGFLFILVIVLYGSVKIQNLEI